MREILFRGQTEKGEWVIGNLFKDIDLEMYMIQGFNYYHDEDGLQREYFSDNVIPETVGQYTGLTDKSGTKIFEGDIVKTHYANAQKADFIETVVFHNGKFCGFYENNGCKQWATLYDGTPHLAIDKSVYMDSVEVIGNIHDNPEFLKGGDGK